MMTGEELKASILQMAMQGKLVEQRPEEGTGEELYQEIQKEKQRLVKEGKIKKRNKFEPVAEDEIPFEIPNTWHWARLADICTKIVDGDHNPPKGLGVVTEYFMASSKNINNDTLVDLDQVRYLDKDTFEKEDERTYARRGDIFFTSVGSLGRSCVYQGALNICFQRSVSVLTTLIFNYFLKYCFDSVYFQSKVFREATGTAQKGFYLNQLSVALIPIPPLKEQKRIVAKIEELMPFVDQYAASSEKLNTLNTTFPDQMKKSILQEAVQGKLVPQDPSDEPASVLLEKIAEEKKKLIKEGKIKKQKKLPPITEDEIPFEIPESWEWVRMDDIVSFENGDRGKNYPHKTEYVSSGVAWINTGHIEPNGFLSKTRMNFITKEKYDSLRSGKIQRGDLVFCLRGATYGKVARVEPYSKGAIASSLMIIRPYVSEIREYIFLYLKSPLAFGELSKYANGSAQPNLGAKDVRKYMVPIPPIAEQKRIVARLDKLFGILEKSI